MDEYSEATIQQIMDENSDDPTFDRLSAIAAIAATSIEAEFDADVQ